MIEDVGPKGKNAVQSKDCALAEGYVEADQSKQQTKLKCTGADCMGDER
jgi:hypothetical protein